MPDVICNDSNANCYHKEEQVKFLLTDEKECNSVYEHYKDTCSIELTTQIYTSFDRGKNFSYIHLKQDLVQKHSSKSRLLKQSLFHFGGAFLVLFVFYCFFYGGGILCFLSKYTNFLVFNFTVTKHLS